MDATNRGDIEGRVRGVIARTFGLDDRASRSDLRMGEPPAWDSIGHMDLIVNLESELRCRIPTHMIGRLTSVGEIVAYARATPGERA